LRLRRGSSTRGCWPQTTQRLVCRETKQLQRCLLCDHGQSEAGPLKPMFAGEKGRRIRRGCSVATASRRLPCWCFAPRLCDACSLDRPALPQRRLSISSPPHTRPGAQQALRCFILPVNLDAFGCSACCRQPDCFRARILSHQAWFHASIGLLAVSIPGHGFPKDSNSAVKVIFIYFFSPCGFSVMGTREIRRTSLGDIRTISKSMLSVTSATCHSRKEHHITTRACMPWSSWHSCLPRSAIW
jgi:hypothetical protein